MSIDKNKWDNLIEQHYISACKRTPDFKDRKTLEEMKEYWYSFLSEKNEKNVEEFIIASTKANNNGYLYHPV